MASAVLPGRIGEPSRVIVLTRRLDGPNRRLLPIVTGTVFSQTLINLLALAMLAGITFTGVPLFHGHILGILTAVLVPLAIVAFVLAGPRLLSLALAALALAAADSRRRVDEPGPAAGATWAHSVRAPTLRLVGGLPATGRMGPAVARPAHGLVALGLQGHATLATAAAVLLAVNLSAVLPATPSNVGVFQAACLVVLAAYGIGAGPGLAYGIILQAVEVLTALLLGIPALLGEGLSLRDIRGSRQLADEGAE